MKEGRLSTMLDDPVMADLIDLPCGHASYNLSLQGVQELSKKVAGFSDPVNLFLSFQKNHE